MENKTGINKYSLVREGLILSSLAILAFLLYSSTLEGPFVFDDVDNIQNNPHIRLTKLTLEGVTRAGVESPASNRPVANLSLALNYYFHQYNPAGYHLVNILIHVTTGILLYLFTRATLNIPSLHSRYGPHQWIPFFTVSIWLLHPIQTQSVTYIVQRMTSMAAMFYILSFLLYAKARLTKDKGKRRTLFAGCILSGIFALGSKEIAVTLPFFILLYEWYFFQELSRTWLKRHALLFSGIFILAAFLAIVFLGGDPLEKILASYKTRDFTLTQRVLTEFRVVIYYISLLIFPHPARLNLDYDYALSHSLIDPITTLLSIGAVGGLIGLAFYSAKKERLFSFCILWFLGNLVIESSVIGLEIIFEHRTYLPSMLVSLMAVTLAHRHIKLKWLRVMVLSAAVILCAMGTYERNRLWTDNVTLWSDCVEKSPKKARPHYNLGYALASQGNLNDAINQYQEALRINPDYADAHYNLGNALTEQGRASEATQHYNEAFRIKPDYWSAHNNLGNALAAQGNIDEAIKHFSEALRIKPDYADAHYNLGNALIDQGKTPEAVEHYTAALQIKPDFDKAHNNLGNALVTQGKPDEAVEHYAAALGINPDFEEAHTNLGNALVALGKYDEAVQHFKAALGIKPGSAKAHNGLGNILARKGKLEEAIGHFSEALSIQPDLAKAHTSLGNALARQGKLEGAVRHYLEALRIKPDFPDEHNNLGNALTRQGRLEEAVSHYLEALRIKSDFPEAHYNLGSALAKQGKLKEAVSHFSEALRIKPDYANAHNNLGSALARQGKLKEAVSHFTEALRIKPHFPGARRNLEIVSQLMDKSPAASDSVETPKN